MKTGVTESEAEDGVEERVGEWAMYVRMTGVR